MTSKYDPPFTPAIQKNLQARGRTQRKSALSTKKDRLALGWTHSAEKSADYKDRSALRFYADLKNGKAMG